MSRSLFIFAVVFVSLMSYLSGCKKEEPELPLEPIALIKPDTTIVRLFPGDSLPVEIQFTTDRPLNWVKCLYDIDSVSGSYTPTYPDTFFFVKLDTLDPRINRYTWSGQYRVPDTLDPYDVIRFRISFEAGKNSFTTGQNYPAGIVSATKEFRIDVR
ncbi:MAG: hypothetical protein NZM35_05445 [Chitinophagales bacterium]|nr:hypothetical protein [Chitinophagales bacterium]MDW8417905.1 hypothetical protein [Chitinophagales bacterium]